MPYDADTRKLMVLGLVFAFIALLFFGVSSFGRRLASGCVRQFLVFWHRGDVALGSQEDFSLKEIQLNELLVKEAAYDKLLEENAQLRNMLGYGPPECWSAVRAEVIGRDPFTWNWEFRIDKGGDDGIRQGNPVLLDGCLLGRVAEAYNASARCVTIASPECKFSGLMQCGETEEYPCVVKGIAPPNGSFEVCAIADFMPRDAKVKAGNMLLTSGMGMEIPYGLKVGTVVLGANGLGCRLIDSARTCSDLVMCAPNKCAKYVMVLIKNDGKGKEQ